MDIKSIRVRLASIRANRADEEVAHSLEDKLRADFIKWVADLGRGELSDMATEVLKSDKIKFARHCA